MYRLQKLSGQFVTFLSLVMLFLIIAVRTARTFTGEYLSEIMPDRFPAWLSTLLFTALAAAAAFAAIAVTDVYNNRVKGGKDKSELPVLLPVAGILILRLAMFMLLRVKVAPAGDFKTYYLLAESMAQGGIFIPDYIAAFPHVIAYPAFLSVFFRVFGGAAEVGIAVNLALSLVCVLLVYMIAGELFGVRAGLLAALVYALSPSQALYLNLLCSEFLFQALMLGYIYLFIRFTRPYITKNSQKLRRSDNVYKLALLGIIGAAMCAVRPAGVVVIIAAAITYLVFLPVVYPDKQEGVVYREDKRYVRRALLCAVMLAAFWGGSHVITLATEQRIGRPVAENRMGWNLYVGLNRESGGTWNTADSARFEYLLKAMGADGAQDILLGMAAERLSEFKAGDVPGFLGDKLMATWGNDHEAHSYIAGASLLENGERHARYGDGSVIPTGRESFILSAKGTKIVSLACDFYYFALLFITAFGLICSAAGENGLISRWAMLLALIFIGTVLAHIPLEGAERYKITALPVLCVLSGYTLGVKWRRPGRGLIGRKKTA